MTNKSNISKMPNEAPPRYSRSFWRDALNYVLHDKLMLVAIFILLVMSLVCYLAPALIEGPLQLDPNDTNVVNRFKLPGEAGLILGGDQLGRDQFLRLIYGGRISLTIAYVASLLTISIGVTLGLLAGYYGKFVDDIISWVINTLSAIPPIFLLLIASALWEPSTEVLVLVLAALGWVGTSRLVRGEVLTLKERDYVLAASALGASNFRILTRHILPNVFPIVIVTMTIIAGNLILVESGLSYLGVGVQPPTPTWGNMLTDSRSYFVTGLHLIVSPGILIMITVLCFYLVGDGLRDALDPRRYQK